MNVLFAESESVGVMIALAPGRPDTLAIIVIVDDLEQTEEVLFLPLVSLKSFLEALNGEH